MAAETKVQATNNTNTQATKNSQRATTDTILRVSDRNSLLAELSGHKAEEAREKDAKANSSETKTKQKAEPTPLNTLAAELKKSYTDFANTISQKIEPLKEKLAKEQSAANQESQQKTITREELNKYANVLKENIKKAYEACKDIIKEEIRESDKKIEKIFEATQPNEKEKLSTQAHAGNVGVAGRLVETVNQAKIQKTQTEKPTEIIKQKQDMLEKFSQQNPTTRCDAAKANEHATTVTPTSVTDAIPPATASYASISPQNNEAVTKIKESLKVLYYSDDSRGITFHSDIYDAFKEAKNIATENNLTSKDLSMALSSAIDIALENAIANKDEPRYVKGYLIVDNVKRLCEKAEISLNQDQKDKIATIYQSKNDKIIKTIQEGKIYKTAVSGINTNNELGETKLTPNQEKELMAALKYAIPNTLYSGNFRDMQKIVPIGIELLKMIPQDVLDEDGKKLLNHLELLEKGSQIRNPNEFTVKLNPVRGRKGLKMRKEE